MNEKIRAFTLLNKTNEDLEAARRKVLSQYKLSCNEYAILEMLFQRGDQTIRQIGEEIMITSGSMTYLIDKLEKNGYIRRQPSPDDRRVIFVIITPDGREMMGRVLPAHNAKIEEIFSCFTEEEAQAITGLLERVRRNMSIA